jgi:hypothetical protein
MIPFERDVYKAMLVQHLKEEADRLKEEIERQKNNQAKINSSLRRGRR